MISNCDRAIPNNLLILLPASQSQDARILTIIKITPPPLNKREKHRGMTNSPICIPYIHKHTVHTLHCTVSSLPIHFTSDMYQQDQSSSPKYERRTQISYHIIFEVRALQHYACCYTIISQPCTWETAWADLGGIHTHVCMRSCLCLMVAKSGGIYPGTHLDVGQDDREVLPINSLGYFF